MPKKVKPLDRSSLTRNPELNNNYSFELKEKVAEFGISLERYDVESEALLQAGFSKEQTDRLILHAGTRSTVQCVLMIYPELMAPPYNLDRDQIFSIARNSGGSNNLKAIKIHFPALIRSGFSPTLIIKIAARCGASLAFEALLENIDELRSHDMSIDQMAKLCQQNGAPKRIQLFLTYIIEMKKKNYSIDETISIIGRKDNINTIRSRLDALVGSSPSETSHPVPKTCSENPEVFLNIQVDSTEPELNEAEPPQKIQRIASEISFPVSQYYWTNERTDLTKDDWFDILEFTEVDLNYLPEAFSPPPGLPEMFPNPEHICTTEADNTIFCEPITKNKHLLFSSQNKRKTPPIIQTIDVEKKEDGLDLFESSLVEGLCSMLY